MAAFVCDCGNRVVVSTEEGQRIAAAGERVTCPKCGKRHKVALPKSAEKVTDTSRSTEPPTSELPTEDLQRCTAVTKLNPIVETAVNSPIEPGNIISPPVVASTELMAKRAKWRIWATVGSVVVLIALCSMFFNGRVSERFESKRAGDERDDKGPVASVKDQRGEKAVASSDKVPELADLIEKIEPAVIVLHVKLKNGRAIGSGFVVESSGIAVTNHHVIDGGEKAIARFADGEEYNMEGVLFADPDRDIAIIKLSNAENLPTLRLAKTLPRKGESTIAFGAPEGLTFTATEGIVSAIRSDLDSEKDALPRAGTWIQTSTPISHGSSGGPLLNRQGEVIGVNALSRVSGQNLNFAVASIEVIDALNLSKDQPVKLLDGIAERQKPFFQKIANQIADRKRQAAKLKPQIETARQRLKQAFVAANVGDELSPREELQSLAKRLKTIATQELNVHEIGFDPPTIGDIGRYVGTRVKVVQTLSKDKGECLAAPIRFRYLPTTEFRGREIPTGPLVEEFSRAIKIRGLDPSDVVDGTLLQIRRNLVFEITGTYTYTTVAGGTNTVFEADCILNTDHVIEAMAKDDAFRVDLSIPPLSEDEEQKRLATQEKNARVAEAARIQREQKEKEERLQRKQIERDERAEEDRKDAQARRAAAEERDKREKEDREKKAAAKLTLAKGFVASNKTDIARKRLRDVISEFPDTSAAEEAKELLKNL